MELTQSENFKLFSSRWDVLARKCVQKKNDKGDTIVIFLEGNGRDRFLSDEDFVKISPHLKSVGPRLRALSFIV